MTRFETTRWSVVIAAGDTDSDRAQEALASLCETYWYPLYAFVRSRGYGADRACDLTQAYFLQLLSKDYIRQARREKGRFRAFLMSTLKHFLANERKRAAALRRGGGVSVFSLESKTAESRYLEEPAEDETPETQFERRWARQVFELALERVRQDYDRRGTARQYEALRPTLVGERPTTSYREMAAALQISEAAVKVCVHRLRQRLGQALRDEIGETVGDARQIDGELRHLLSILDPGARLNRYLWPGGA